MLRLFYRKGDKLYLDTAALLRMAEINQLGNDAAALIVPEYTNKLMEV